MTTFAEAGSRDSRETRFAPIFVDRFFAGLFTNRNPLRSPFSALITAYYRVAGLDAMIDGLNTELSNHLTIIRRPGNFAGYPGIIPSTNVPDVVDSFYSFHEITGTVRVIADGKNNGPYLATPSAWVPLFSKEPGAGQAYYSGVAQALYFGDSIEEQKWLDFGAGNPGNSFSSVTATAASGGFAVITAVNNFVAGQEVVISGTTNGGGVFNGNFTIVSATSSQFYFAMSGTIASAAETNAFASATWNLGIAAPTQPPAITVVASGAAAVAWQANTYFTTMGLIKDVNGNIQQLISVNALGGNTTQFGLSGNGAPPFQLGTGLTTTDGTVTWESLGPITLWKANTVYQADQPIWDPNTNCIFIMSQSGPRTSGTKYPPFNSVLALSQGGPFIVESDANDIKWQNIGQAGVTPSGVQIWAPNTVFNTYNITSTGVRPQHQNSAIVYPLKPFLGANGQLCNGQPTYLIVAVTGGTTSASTYTPWTGQTGQVAGQITQDNQLLWLCLGSGTWAAQTPYSAWNGQGTVFSVIVDPNGRFQACIQSGISGTSQPTWSTTYGSQTKDGSVVWVCVDNGTTPLAWAANSTYHLPSAGFFPPSGTQAYGGSEVIGSNFVQAVTTSGKSGVSAPAWSVTIGNTTTDNSIIWTTVAAYIQNSIAFSHGYGFAYAFKARTKTDVYSLTSLGGGGVSFGLPSTSPAGTTANGIALAAAPTGSADGTVSSASPTFQITGSSTGSVFFWSGQGSTDPQVDTISLFRTVDGGATYFWLTDIPNPAPVGGQAGTWKFQDFLPDNANATFNGLNTQVIAPLANFNNPPPVGAINFVQHLGRLWASVGANVYASNGPLVGGAAQPPGNAYTNWNPAQVFVFPSPVTKLVPTNNGLLVFTTSDLFIISGGPLIGSLFPQIWVPGLGLSSFNALGVQGGLTYLFTADRQGIVLDPNMGVNEIGFPIGDKLVFFSPTATYVTSHIQGSNDKAVFFADGSTGWYRCVPNMAPDAQITGGVVWSPKANIVQGAGAIQSLEITPGTHALLIASTSANQPVLVRDSSFSVFTDDGIPYEAFATIGNMVLAQPGQLAECAFVTCDYVRTGTSPHLAVMLDEIAPFNATITAASQVGGNTVYSYTLATGAVAPVPGMQVTIAGMSISANNGTFVISSIGVGTFTVPNASGQSQTGQSGTVTNFEDLSGYTLSTGLPPQDPPDKWGAINTPASLYPNRYYFGQSINGQNPQTTFCRHLQLKIDFGATDTVKNEILSLTIFGAHWGEM